MAYRAHAGSDVHNINKQVVMFTTFCCEHHYLFYMHYRYHCLVYGGESVPFVVNITTQQHYRDG